MSDIMAYFPKATSGLELEWDNQQQEGVLSSEKFKRKPLGGLINWQSLRMETSRYELPGKIVNE